MASSDNGDVPTTNASVDDGKQHSEAENDSPFKKPQLKAPAPGETKPAPSSQQVSERKVPEQQSFSYNEPTWSAMPPADRKYYLEVIKGGTVIEPVDLSKRSYFIVGRMTDCHIPLQHPSLSRYHAVIQYCRANAPGLRNGWYIYDLGSSNGTVVNKKRLQPLNYRPVEIGHVIKFGMSTRLFVLQGKQEEPEESQPVEQTKPTFQIPEGLKLKRPKPSQPNRPPPPSGASEEGCMWGISMDDEAVYESAEVDPNFDSSSDSSDDSSGDENGEGKKEKKKPLDLSDPKKTLRVFFEREDLGLPEYQIENIGKNRHRAWLEIPTESGTGKAIRVEGEGGNKKEAVIACAREACITLDKLNILRPRHKTSKKKDSSRDWAANDYYDSDEDNFFDRTGDLEQKRQQRMLRAKTEKLKQPSGSSSGVVHTEQSLASDLERMDAEIAQISAQLAEDEQKRADFAASRPGGKAGSELDALDAYMSALKQGVSMDATTRVRLKHRLMELQKERSRCDRLLSIARGPNIPASLRTNAWASTSSTSSEAPSVSSTETKPALGPSTSGIGKLPRSLPPVKFSSNLPKLPASIAFDNGDDDDDLGMGKSKVKKLEDFIKDDEKPAKSAQSQDADAALQSNEKPAKVDAKQENESEINNEDAGDEDDNGDKKVYSVFLPPEFKQSLETHADEIDDIWDVNRAKRITSENNGD